MIDALQLLEGGNALMLLDPIDGSVAEYEKRCVGRPTKQRLAKHGLAEFLDPLEGESKWDAPMRITEAGRVALAGVRAGRRHPAMWSDAYRRACRVTPPRDVK